MSETHFTHFAKYTLRKKFYKIRKILDYYSGELSLVFYFDYIIALSLAYSQFIYCRTKQFSPEQ